MMNRTLVATAIVLAMSGAAHAGTKTNDGSPNSADGANSTTPSPGTGTPGTPVANTNDGTPTTKDGRPGNFSRHSVGSDSSPIRNTNDGSPATNDGRDLKAKRDYSKSTDFNKFRSEKAPYAARASDVVGADVIDAKHNDIGEVDDVFISRSDNRMHAVIEVGGFLGMGEKLIAVPLDELKMDGHGNVYLDTTESELKQLPTFAYYDNEPMGMDRWKSRGIVRNRGTFN